VPLNETRRSKTLTFGGVFCSAQDKLPGTQGILALPATSRRPLGVASPQKGLGVVSHATALVDQASRLSLGTAPVAMVREHPSTVSLKCKCNPHWRKS